MASIKLMEQINNYYNNDFSIRFVKKFRKEKKTGKGGVTVIVHESQRFTRITAGACACEVTEEVRPDVGDIQLVPRCIR